MRVIKEKEEEGHTLITEGQKLPSKCECALNPTRYKDEDGCSNSINVPFYYCKETGKVFCKDCKNKGISAYDSKKRSWAGGRLCGCGKQTHIHYMIIKIKESEGSFQEVE